MKKFISYLLGFCLSVSMVFCVSEAGAVFLLISPGAAAQGSGEAQVARAEDAYSSYFNPAGLSFIDRNEVVLQHCNWLPNLATDIYFDFIGFNRHIGSGTLGGHLIYLNLGAQDATNSDGLILGQFRSYMTAMALGYSTTLKPHSSIGFNFKVYHQRLADSVVGNEGEVGGSDDGSSTDLAFDLGYLLKFGKAKQHNFGLAIQNIGPPIDFVDAEQADPAPTNMKIGFNFLLHETENTKIKMLFDMNKLLVASYQAMDWDGDGYIDGSIADPNVNNEFEIYETDDWRHKDEWYKGVFNAWLDDWYYGGDYDKSRPNGLAVDGMLSKFWYEDGENGEVNDEYADGRIGGFVYETWDHVELAKFGKGEQIEIGNDWYDNVSNAVPVSQKAVFVPNYTGFCEETYRSFKGLNEEGGSVFAGAENDTYGSMCYDENGTQYNPGGNNDTYGQHAWIDMPNDGFGEVDTFDYNCDPAENFDCSIASDWNTTGALSGSVDIGHPSAVQVDGVDYSTHDGDGVCDDNEVNCISLDFEGNLANGQNFNGSLNNVTRLDIHYDRNGEHVFGEAEYGPYNPYGYKELGSGDDRSFQNELEEVVYNFGVEYNYSSSFVLRAGFIYDLEGDVKNPTVGAGLKFNNYGFDFGYTSGETDHPRANTMFFSLSIGMGA